MRPATSADDEALLMLWNQAAPYDFMSTRQFEEKIHSDPEATTFVAETRGHPLGFATLVTRELPDEIRGIIKLIAVAPDAQRRGVGTLLLHEAERDLARREAMSVRVGESFPNYLTPGVDVRYMPARNFFASHGYVPFAEAVNFEVDLDQLPATRDIRRSLASGTTIRRATRDVSRAIADLISTHWPPWWGEVSQALSNEPVTLFVAWQGENLVGFAAHDANNRSTGWFGPMGTVPEVRGQGIGVALLYAALDDMRERGFHRATIPWVGPVAFYERHAGAKLARTFQRFQKPLPASVE